MRRLNGDTEKIFASVGIEIVIGTILGPLWPAIMTSASMP